MCWEPVRASEAPFQGFPNHPEDLLVHVIGSQHPPEVIRRRRRDLPQRLPPVLPPAKHQFAVPAIEPSVELGLEGAHLVAVGVEAIEGSGEVGVFLELGGEDRRRGSDVPQGRVGFFVLPAQVEPGGGREIPWALPDER